MKIILKVVITILLFLHINCLYARNKHKEYKTTIKHMDGRKSKGRLILATDTSLLIVTSRNDTLNILSTDIKKLKIKQRFKHGTTFGATMGITAIITGIIAYSTYQDSEGFIGRNTGTLLSAVFGGLFVGGPLSGILIGLKELSKKKYHINGSQLKYGYVKPYLKKYY